MVAQLECEKGVSLPAPAYNFTLRETVYYPNGGKSLFFTHRDRQDVAIIVDDGICDVPKNGQVFDYSLITGKQNEYVADYDHVYRFLADDLDEVGNYLTDVEFQDPSVLHKVADRSDMANVSPLEHEFEKRFASVYGPDAVRFLWREYGFTDREGHTRFIDYLVKTKDGLLGVEENGVTYHHPQQIGKERYRKQLLKQNSCEHAGIKLFRFSTEELKFVERFEDDISTYFGKTCEGFVDSGLVLDRGVKLYEHQEGALEEMARRREEGTKSFLAVFPTASGKSRIVEEDIARFAPTRPGFRALIMAPNTQIVEDWRKRVHASLPEWERHIQVCTFAYMSRHYLDYAPDYFAYVVVDEAHHAVAPALKRTIQYFVPDFLVGLTATDQRPDKKSLETVFGSYRIDLSLAEAMEKGIVATARAFRIETNIDLSKVRINGREYVNADLEKTVRVTSRNDLIVDVLKEYFSEGEMASKQGVVFCVSIAHTNEMAKLLNAAGISAKALNGTTKRSEKVMEDFRSGKIRFLCSCQMISEGWDYPELSILVMARPTLSRVLYLQQLGRGLRRTPTKSDVFVVDVVDEYGVMAMPCSLHTIFQNPYYVPFGSILNRGYTPGEMVEVAGLHERVERIYEVDVTSFAEKYEGYLSVEQVARDYFVNTGTINSWVRKGKITPTVSFDFGSKKVHMFSQEDVDRYRDELDIPVHTDETIRDDFFEFLESRDYSYSYKMIFLPAFLDHMDKATGEAPLADIIRDYTAFYQGRIDQGLTVDRRGCPYTTETLKSETFVKHSILTNPFEKFERKRFMYHSKDLGLISLNHALLMRLSDEDYERIRNQMRQDLEDYYARL